MSRDKNVSENEQKLVEKMYEIASRESGLSVDKLQQFVIANNTDISSILSDIRMARSQMGSGDAFRQNVTNKVAAVASGIPSVGTSISAFIEGKYGPKNSVSSGLVEKYQGGVDAYNEATAKAAFNSGVVAQQNPDGTTTYSRPGSLASLDPAAQQAVTPKPNLPIGVASPTDDVNPWLATARSASLLGDSPNRTAYSQGMIQGRLGGVGQYALPANDKLNQFGPTVVDSPDARKRVNQYWRFIGAPVHPVSDDKFWKAHFAARALQDPWMRDQEMLPDMENNKQGIAGAVRPFAAEFISGALFGLPKFGAALGVSRGLISPDTFTDPDKLGYTPNRWSAAAKALGEVGSFFVPSGAYGKLAKWMSIPGLRGTEQVGGTLPEMLVTKGAKLLESRPATAGVGKALGKIADAAASGETKLAAARYEASRKIVGKTVGTALSSASSMVQGSAPIRIMRAFDYVSGGVRGAVAAKKLSSGVVKSSGVLDLIAEHAGPEFLDTTTLGLSKKAVDQVERIVSDSIGKTTANTWAAARHTPYTTTINDAIVETARKTGAQTFAGIVTRELKKLMPTVDDESMRPIIEGLTKGFDETLTSSTSAQKLLANPLKGAFPLADRLAANKYSNFIARTALDATYEGAGNVVQAMTNQYNKALFDITMTYKDPESGIDPETIPKSFLGYSKWAADATLATAFDMNSPGNIRDQFVIGGVFGTKAIIGNLPWMSRRYFPSIGAGAKFAFGRVGKMLPAEEFMTMLTDAGNRVAERVAKALGASGNDDIISALRTARVKMSATGGRKLGPRGARALVDQVRGRLDQLNNKELAYVAAMAREHARSFKGGFSKGIFSAGRLDAITDDVLERLHNADGEIADRAKERVLGAMANDTELLIDILKNKSKVTVAKDLARNMLTAVPIFAATGGIEMLRNVGDGDVTPDEIANVLTHTAFSWMSASHTLQGTGIPDHLKSEYYDNDGNVIKNPPSWLRTKHELNSLQAQLYYNGADTKAFMAYDTPPPDSNTLMSHVAFGRMNRFTAELTREINASREAYDTQDRYLDAVDKPTNVDEESYDDIDMSEKMLSALINAGVKFDSSWDIDGIKPTDRQEFMNAVRNLPNKAEYLGHVTRGMKSVLRNRGLWKEGEPLRLEKLYQSARLEIHDATAKALRAFHEAADAIAREVQDKAGLNNGFPSRLQFFQFADEPELNRAIDDLFDVVGAVPGTTAIHGGVPDSVMRVNRLADYERAGRKMADIGGVEFVKSILDRLYTKLDEAGIDSKKMRLGDAGSTLKNGLLDALGAVGRHTIAELFHFRGAVGMATKEPYKQQLLWKNVIAAAKKAGLIARVPLDVGNGSREVLRPIDHDWLSGEEQTSEKLRMRAIQLRWLHDMLSSMSDVIYTASDEAAGSLGIINSWQDTSAGRAGHEYDLGTLWDGDQSAAIGEGENYNPIYEPRVGSRDGGLFGAMHDAGIYIGSESQAAHALADIYALKDMNMTESQALARAAIKINKLSYKDPKHGERLLTVADIIRYDLGDELSDQLGKIGDLSRISTRGLADLVRRALGDKFSQTDLEDGQKLPRLIGGMQSKLLKYIAKEAILDARSDAKTGGRTLSKDYLRELIEEAISDYYGFDLAAYTKMGDELIKAGYYRSWATDTGKSDGTPTVLRPNLFKGGGMPILREVIDPLRDVSVENRQRFVEGMRKQIMGSSSYGKDVDLTKRADWFLAEITRLSRSGSATSMARLRSIIDGVGTITFKKEDGRKIAVVKLRDVTNRGLAKAFDKMEKFNLGIGDSVDLFQNWAAEVRNKTEELTNMDLFSHKSTITRGVSFNKLLDRMRISSVDREAHHAELSRIVTSIDNAWAGKSGYGDTAMTNQAVSEIRAMFVDIANRQGNERVADEVNCVLDTLNRNDYIGLFMGFVKRRSTILLTRSAARQIDFENITTPTGDTGQTTDGVLLKGRRGVESRTTAKPSGVSEGDYSGRYQSRSHSVMDVVVDELEGFLGPDRGPAIELNDNDESTNKSLTKGVADGTLELYAKDFLRNGLSRPSGEENVLEMNSTNVATGTPWRMGDNRPLWLQRLGDTKIQLIRMANSREELSRFLTATDRVLADLPGNLADYSRDYRRAVARLRDDNGNVRYNSLVEAMDDGQITLADIGNIYTMMSRAAIHGRARIGDAIGGTKANKRYTQVASDSYIANHSGAFSMSVAEAVRRRYMTGQEAGLIRDNNGTYRLKTLIVDEAAWTKMGSVLGLDGNINAAPWLLDVLAIGQGFNPDSPRQFYQGRTPNLDGRSENRGMLYGAYKGFVFGEMNTRPGENILTKTLITAMPEQNRQLAERLDVALIIPKSSIKLGEPANPGMVNFTDAAGATTSMYFAEAAQMARINPGSTVSLVNGDPNVIEITPDMIKFQNMFDPGQTQAAMTGQMTQGWSPEAIGAMLDNAHMFPVSDVINLASMAMGYQRGNMEYARALFEMSGADDEAGGLENRFKPSDHSENIASLLEVTLIDNPLGSPSPMFKAEVERRLFKLVQERLYKGHTSFGGTSALRPDYSYSLRSGQMVGGVQMGRTLVDLSMGHMGLERTHFIDWSTGTPAIRPYTSLDAAEHASDQFGYLERGRPNFAATPSAGQSPASVARGQTTNINVGILDKFSRTPRTVQRGGNPQAHNTVKGFMANILENVWAGGMWAHGRNTGSVRVSAALELFSRDVGGNTHIPAANLDGALKVANDTVVDVLNGSDPNEVQPMIGRMVSQLQGLSNTPRGQNLAAQFGRELSRAVEVYSRNLGRDVWRGTSRGRWTTANGRQKAMYADDLMGFFTSLLGHHIAGDSPNRQYRGFEINRRFSRGDPNNPGVAPVDAVGFDGETPAVWGITGLAQRSPSARLNDTVAFMMRGFLDPEEGGLAVLSHRDVVEQMEGDYDFDTFKYTWAMPSVALGDAIRLKNIIGPLGDKHADKVASSFSPLVRVNPWGTENQYLKYISDQQTAAAMKGQIIAARSAIEKMISGQFTFRYIDNDKEYELRPIGTMDEIHQNHMERLLEIYGVTQAILDTPGSFLSDTTVRVNGRSVGLDKLNVLDLIFGNMYQKRVLSGDDVRSNDTIPLNEDFDRGVLNDVLNLLINGSALARDSRDGNKIVAKTPQERIRLARNYVDIMGLGDTNVRTQRLVEYLKRINRTDDPRLKSDGGEGNKGFRFEFVPDRTFTDAINQWTVEIADKMNGDATFASDVPSKSGAKAAREVADDMELLNLLQDIENEPGLRSELFRLKDEQTAAGGPKSSAGSYYEREIKQLEGAISNAATFNDGLIPTIKPSRNGFGRDAARKLRDSTILGYAMRTTLANIPDSFDDSRASAKADHAAGRLLRQISQIWAGSLSGRGTADTAVRPEYAQELTNQLVNNFFEQLDSNGRHTEDLAARLLIPSAVAFHYINGVRHTAFKPTSQYIIRSIMARDPNMMTNILQDYNINSIVYSEAFSSGSIIGSQGIIQQFNAIAGFDARVGEQRMMLRHSLRSLPIDNPIFEAAKANMVRRYTRSEMKEYDDVILSTALGSPIRGANRVLTDTFRTLLNMQDWQGHDVSIMMNVDQGSVMPLPGVRELIDTNNMDATITAERRSGVIEDRWDVGALRAERETIKRDQLSREKGRRVEILEGPDRTAATKEAVRTFNKTMTAVGRALTARTVGETTVFKKGADEYLSLEQRARNTQAEINRQEKQKEQDKSGKNCHGKGK